MKHLFLALALSLLLLTGCAQRNASSSSASSDLTSSAAPVYTYVDSAPDMVLATLPSGNITYNGYRLYIDTNERMDRAYAKQDLALSAVLEKDLTQLGVSIDEAYFDRTASEQVEAALASEGYTQGVETLRTVSGLTDAQLQNAMKLIFRPQYLTNLLYEHYHTAAQASHPVGAVNSTPVASSADPSNAAPISSLSPEEQAEQERQSRILEDVSGQMDAYYARFKERCDFSNHEILAVIDGNAVNLTAAQKDFITYIGLSNRLNTIAKIQGGEAMLRELERRAYALDEPALAEDMAAYISSLQSDAATLVTLSDSLSSLGATLDDYYKAVERPLRLQYAGYDFSEMLVSDYAALATDDPKRPATEDEYVQQRIQELLGDGELGNILGK
ncbi:MAG: hypothetical protein RR135_00700 [Oscillospiraceae bacterium]